jgi:hypothetical protein
MVASVDLDDLPPATAKKVRSALAEVDFEPAPAPRAAGRRAAPARFPDAYQYDLEVHDGRKRSITLHDPVSSPEVQALLDVLLPLAEPE